MTRKPKPTTSLVLLTGPEKAVLADLLEPAAFAIRRAPNFHISGSTDWLAFERKRRSDLRRLVRLQGKVAL